MLGSHEDNIVKIIHNTMDLCGSWHDEVMDYCKDNHIAYEGQYVQEACFIAVRTYKLR